MKFLSTIIFVLVIVSCHTEPQPLVIGKDNCHFCQMPVADTKFGGEIITMKGKLYKFDDVGCMLGFLKNGLGTEEKVNKIFVVTYSSNPKLLDVNTTVFLKNENLRTPMNSGIAAFESGEEAKSFLKDFPSEILTWQQIQQDLK